MKHLVLLTFFLPLIAWAQSPQAMSFQFVLRDSSGSALSKRDVSVRVSILRDSARGTAVYSELHKSSTNANGLAYLSVGKGTPLQGVFATIPWGKGVFFIQTETDPTNGTNYRMKSVAPLLSVPYAFHSITADSLTRGVPKIPDGKNKGDMLYWDGTQWALLPIGQASQRLMVASGGKPEWATPSGALFSSDSLSIPMVMVAGGTYRMGCTPSSASAGDCKADENPVHEVVLPDFHIGKYEVTQKLWTQVMGINPSYFGDCPECPVENVSWTDVQVFLATLNARTGKNYRLPTEAEWEYAARGGKSSRGLPFAGSSVVDSVAWSDNFPGTEGKTHRVGQKTANELGIFDMSGNVYEWVQDWYNEDYYAKSPKSNPPGPVAGQRKVARGGAWADGAEVCRVSNREAGSPNSRSYVLGFRLAY
ncbi:MAG: hypothetical protein RL181_1709 [Bacteroidota bacterium]